MTRQLADGGALLVVGPPHAAATSSDAHWFSQPVRPGHELESVTHPPPGHTRLCFAMSHVAPPSTPGHESTEVGALHATTTSAIPANAASFTAPSCRP